MLNKIVRADGTVLNGVKTVAYTERTNATEELRAGCVSAAEIDVAVYGEQDGAVEAGEALTYYQVDADGNEQKIGIFYAEPTIQTKGTYQLIAYDAALRLDANYSARLSEIQNKFPMQLRSLVEDVCEFAGVPLTGTFPMSDIEVQAFYLDSITCRDILSWAAEIACRFVRCDADGNLRFDWYEKVVNYRVAPGDGSRDGETYIYYKQDGLHYENYETEYLDNVAIRPMGTEGVAYIYPTVNTEDVYATDPGKDGNVQIYNVSVTDDGLGNITFVSDIDAFSDGLGHITIRAQSEVQNVYTIENNVLLNNASDATILAVAQHIYNTLRETGIYRPAQISLFPFNNPFRAGQIIKVTDIQGVSFQTLVMSMTLLDSEALLESTGNQQYSTPETSIKGEIINLLDKIARIKAGEIDVDALFAQDITATGSFQTKTDHWWLTVDGDGFQLSPAPVILGGREWFDAALTMSSNGTTLADNNHLWLFSYDLSIECPGSIKILGNLIPTRTSVNSIGNSEKRWGTLYTTTSPNVSSDRAYKEDIQPLDLDVIDALKPVSYRIKGHRTRHYGLIAQDVEEALEDLGEDTGDLGLLGFSETDGVRHDYSLRYGEIIPLLIDKCQRQQKQINDLERRMAELLNRS